MPWEHRWRKQLQARAVGAVAVAAPYLTRCRRMVLVADAQRGSKPPAAQLGSKPADDQLGSKPSLLPEPSHRGLHVFLRRDSADGSKLNRSNLHPNSEDPPGHDEDNTRALPTCSCTSLGHAGSMSEQPHLRGQSLCIPRLVRRIQSSATCPGGQQPCKEDRKAKRLGAAEI